MSKFWMRLKDYNLFPSLEKVLNIKVKKVIDEVQK